jgi:hypothetical protein
MRIMISPDVVSREAPHFAVRLVQTNRHVLMIIWDLVRPQPVSSLGKSSPRDSAFDNAGTDARWFADDAGVVVRQQPVTGGGSGRRPAPGPANFLFPRRCPHDAPERRKGIGFDVPAVGDYAPAEAENARSEFTVETGIPKSTAIWGGWRPCSFNRTIWADRESTTVSAGCGDVVVCCFVATGAGACVVAS